MKAREDWMPTEKQQIKLLGYGLITPYDHKKIELAQATLDAKVVEYEGKKELLLTQLEVLTGVEKERLRLINPVLVPVESLPLQKASKKELKFVHSIMELMLQIIKYKQKEHGGFQKFS